MHSRMSSLLYLSVPLLLHALSPSPAGSSRELHRLIHSTPTVSPSEHPLLQKHRGARSTWEQGAQGRRATATPATTRNHRRLPECYTKQQEGDPSPSLPAATTSSPQVFTSALTLQINPKPPSLQVNPCRPILNHPCYSSEHPPNIIHLSASITEQERDLRREMCVYSVGHGSFPSCPLSLLPPFIIHQPAYAPLEIAG